MLYLIALFIPPLAILFCGKPFQALTNLVILVASLILSVVGIGLLGLPVCLLHGLFVVHNYYADERNNRVVRAIRAATAVDDDDDDDDDETPEDRRVRAAIEAHQRRMS